MSENRDEILLAIKDQGELVRKLKAEKQSKERVSDPEILSLLSTNFTYKLHNFTNSELLIQLTKNISITNFHSSLVVFIAGLP